MGHPHNRSNNYTSPNNHLHHWTCLLPGHGHVLEELEDGVGHVLERAQVDALVMPGSFIIMGWFGVGAWAICHTGGWYMGLGGVVRRATPHTQPTKTAGPANRSREAANTARGNEKKHTKSAPELLGAHVPVVPDDLAHVLFKQSSRWCMDGYVISDASSSRRISSLPTPPQTTRTQIPRAGSVCSPCR